MIELNGVRLRNRVVTSSSLLGYGAPRGRLVLYGLSPFAQWVPLERFGAVTTRTLSLEPREGHFTLREDWQLRRVARAVTALRAGAAPGRWGLAERLWLVEYRHRGATFATIFRRRTDLNRIVSLGGFSADEFCQLVDVVNARRSARRDRRCRVQRVVPQRQLPVRDDPGGGAGHGRRPQSSPGAAEAVAGLRLRGPCPTCRTLRGGRPGGDQHGQRPAARPAYRPAAPEEPLWGIVGAGDQADRVARGCRSCARRAFGYRSSPRAAFAPSTIAASTSGPAPTRSVWGAKSGWRPTGATRWGRSADCRFNGSSSVWRRYEQTTRSVGRDLVANGGAAGRLSAALGRAEQLLHR